MKPLDVDICKFVCNKPFGTATLSDVNNHFSTVPPAVIAESLQHLAECNYFVVTEDGTRFNIPHAYPDGKPIIGKRL